MEEHTVEKILKNGPFDRRLTEKWPEEMQKDYLELMSLDLAELGLDEFTVRARELGETYLLSVGKPIRSNRVLLEAWWSLTDGSPPPPPLRFHFETPQEP